MTDAVAQHDRLRVIVAGAGGMGRAWLRTVQESAEVDLVGLVEIDAATARTAIEEFGLTDVVTGSDLAAVAGPAAAQAVIDVTPPAAHLPVTLQALQLGLPVLGEKPAAATLSQALIAAAATEAFGQLFMVSQSRSYHPELDRFKQTLGQLGTLGVATTEFFRAPHFGGFRDAMDHPLLLDMAIHPFDAARYLLGAEPVSVYCEEYNPPWSWYQGDAATSAVFEMTSGLRYVYVGSWCSPGLETSWNGAWRISGERGSARWDGDHAPTVEETGVTPAAPAGEAVPAGDAAQGDAPSGIAGSLAEFVHALRTGAVPWGEIHDNLTSLAMVEGAVLSASTGRRIGLDQVFDTAYTRALDEASEPALGVLHGWPSVPEALAQARVNRTWSSTGAGA